MLTNIHEIRIEGLPAPVTVSCPQGTLLLDAMVAAGVPIAYCCRAGICGMCKTVLTSGEVDHDTSSERALSPEERSSGQVLTCRASPLSACVVRPLNVLGSAGSSFSGTLGTVVTVETLALPVDAPLFVVTARVQEARQLDAWHLGHWAWVESLDGERANGSVAASYAGTDPTDPCVGHWVLRGPAATLDMPSLGRDPGAVLFFDGPHGTPLNTEIAGSPFVLVTDTLGMPFVGALAWRKLLGDPLHADAVCFAGAPVQQAHGMPAGRQSDAAGSALSPAWSVTASADLDPALLREALSTHAARATAEGRRMRIVTRGASGFQGALRRALRGSGIRQWDVHAESTLDLEQVPPNQ